MKTHAATIILGILMITWVSLNSWASDQDRNTSLDQQQNPEIRRELTSNGETMEEVKKKQTVRQYKSGAARGSSGGVAPGLDNHRSRHPTAELSTAITQGAWRQITTNHRDYRTTIPLM